MPRITLEAKLAQRASFVRGGARGKGRAGKGVRVCGEEVWVAEQVWLPRCFSRQV